MGRIQSGDKTYLTMAETCEILKCSDSRVRQLILEERLVASKLPGTRARVITLESVVDYLAAKRMMNGLTADDIALSLVRIERRLRRLEYSRVPSHDAEPLSLASKLLTNIEVLKHHKKL